MKDRDAIELWKQTAVDMRARYDIARADRWWYFAWGLVIGSLVAWALCIGYSALLAEGQA